VNHRDDNERLLVGCISDQIIADGLKPEAFRSEIQAPVTLFRKSRKLADRFQDMLTEACNSSGIVLCDKLPDFGDVVRGTRMKLKSLAHSLFRRAPLGEFTFALTQVFEESFTVNGFDAAALNIIVAAIEQTTKFGDFDQISSHSVFTRSSVRRPLFEASSFRRDSVSGLRRISMLSV